MSPLNIPLYDKVGYATRLVEERAASRVHAEDASLYDFDPAAVEHASCYMGWTALASEPPLDPCDLQRAVEGYQAQGLDAVVLIGQGGSSQSAAAMAQVVDLSDGKDIPFHVLDTLAPDTVNQVLDACDPAHTVFIVSSKSGTTLEPTLMERVVWDRVCQQMGYQQAATRFVAITSEGTLLDARARERGYAHVFHVPGTVGGRYSVLTAYGLFPLACLGVSLEDFMAQAREMELLCAQDSLENPALRLAAFLMENLDQGRDKLSLLLPFPARCFGFWVEQLLAESLGKQGKGILPSSEYRVDVLGVPREDRSAILYSIGGLQAGSLEDIDGSIPCFPLSIDRPEDAATHFILWEYATALCGHLLEVNPFDQPDVESTKMATRAILYGGTGEAASPASQPEWEAVPCDDPAVREARISQALCGAGTPVDLDQALRTLFSQVKGGAYFTIASFLPITGEADLDLLEDIRSQVALDLGSVACVGLGPSYLHSTGQFHKGGPNTGVFLVLAADESDDLPIPEEDFTLGAVAVAQAEGDFEALSNRGRRALLVHLSDNAPALLQGTAERIKAAIQAVSEAR